MSYEYDGIEQIETDELFRLFQENNPNIVFLDVREQAEYDAGHIPGVYLLPTSQFIVRYETELDKNKEYIVICRSGVRSQQVCHFLKAQGFPKCRNYTQGMLGWIGEVER